MKCAFESEKNPKHFLSHVGRFPFVDSVNVVTYSVMAYNLLSALWKHDWEDVGRKIPQCCDPRFLAAVLSWLIDYVNRPPVVSEFGFGHGQLLRLFADSGQWAVPLTTKKPQNPPFLLKDQ